MNAEWLTAQEAAEYLRLKKKTVEAKAREGLIKAASNGRGWLFKRIWLDDFLISNGRVA